MTLGDRGGPPQEGTGQEGLGTSIQARLVLLYTNDGLVASPKRARLQGEVDALTGLFEYMSL